MGLLKVGELGYQSARDMFVEGSSGDHPQVRWEERARWGGVRAASSNPGETTLKAKSPNKQLLATLDSQLPLSSRLSWQSILLARNNLHCDLSNTN